MNKVIIILIILITCCNGSIKKPDKVEINIVDGVWVHSHNDYLADNPIYDALKEGCQILEYDVIFGHGEVYVSHDDKWYDSPLSYYGSLSDYLDEITEIVNEYDIKLYLYLEVKDPIDLKEPLYDILKEYQNNNIQYLPDAWSFGEFPEREIFITDFMESYREELSLIQYGDFVKGKTILDIDVYGR